MCEALPRSDIENSVFQRKDVSLCIIDKKVKII